MKNRSSKIKTFMIISAKKLAKITASVALIGVLILCGLTLLFDTLADISLFLKIVFWAIYYITLLSGILFSCFLKIDRASFNVVEKNSLFAVAFSSANVWYLTFLGLIISLAPLKQFIFGTFDTFPLYVVFICIAVILSNILSRIVKKSLKQ